MEWFDFAVYGYLASTLAYNIALAAVAGPGPFVAAGLFTATGNALSPALYLVAVAAACLPILLTLLPETRGRDLFRTLSVRDESVASGVGA